MKASGLIFANLRLRLETLCMASSVDLGVLRCSLIFVGACLIYIEQCRRPLTGKLDPVTLSSTLETIVLSISNASSLETLINVGFAPVDST